MFLNINPSNGIAIYDQVVRQVKFAVAQGAVKPGNLVPSVREMARELAINPNTVARAYLQLQADGVLEQVRGMGLEVADDAVKQCKSERQKMIQDRIRQALVEAKQSGLEGDELRQIIEKQLTSVLRDGR
ncbi:MAG: GntR family transcriptional regulator [Planctomycetota bacterium]|nr:GntR family transcriptional regulator [Planctomycetota bacterium]